MASRHELCEELDAVLLQCLELFEEIGELRVRMNGSLQKVLSSEVIAARVGMQVDLSLRVIRDGLTSVGRNSLSGEMAFPATVTI
jgi:hypothetical protein